ncbi:unnamed protein product, partial [Polarella glacialis]
PHEGLFSLLHEVDLALGLVQDLRVERGSFRGCVRHMQPDVPRFSSQGWCSGSAW